MRIPAIIIGLICLICAIWFGLPMTGVGFLSTVWLRTTLIGLIIGTILVMMFFKWRARRKKAKELEDALIPAEPEGDGKILSERMQSALATLKKSGGSAYLYDLPWYVIIGPPGAGKTTALQNSGIEFPLAQKDDDGVVEGFGGTRYCDWWFAEDAVMIDTAGRYTTQDSDKTADESSWKSFLELLKKARPSQPINGIILAFSVEDMMTGTEESLTRHAETVRARLAEVHEALRVDFPVYVLFTKADLISGFREYFSSFNINRRKNVWGVTFQTKDRKEQTHESVPTEFDKLVSRLSDEVIDRLSEEPDGISRVAIFGLPGQMALLRDNVSDFLRRVFEPTRYKSNAILRGFYFTSGTQEGTPIDQVLGAMARNEGAAGAFAPSFMSGQGKSFFIHDLLKRVIFEERDWVSHDVRAVRRQAIMRGLGLSVIGITTAGVLAALGFSYWLNRDLVNTARTEGETYARQANTEILRTEIEDRDLDPILPHLERLRTMPAGYGTTAEATIWEGFGLSQRDRVQASTTNAYSDALEQMLRPRLLLDVERRLQEIRNTGEPAEIYRALKVYMLLGGQGEREDNEAVIAWFDDTWRETFTGREGLTKREQLGRHLEAMLNLDDTREISVTIDENAVETARDAIVRMSVADQAYALISDKAKASGMSDFNLVERTGSESVKVFITTDERDLTEIGVPALYTYEGYWGFFFDQLDVVRDRLVEDKWVLGEQASDVDFDAQLAGLDQALHSRYTRDFVAAWDEMFASVKLANLSADKPRYDALGAAAGDNSPLLRLAEAVKAETRLTRELEELDGLDASSLLGGGGGEGGAEGVATDVGGAIASRFRSRSSGVQRMLLDAMANQAKDQVRVNGSSGGMTAPLERIEAQFEKWYEVLDGPMDATAMDALQDKLGEILGYLTLAETNPEQAAQFMPQALSALIGQTSRYPAKIQEMIDDAYNDFQEEATDATLAEMNRALANDITFSCRENITAYYPFRDTDREVSIAAFGNFFGPGGDMDTFYSTYLARHVIRTADGLAIDESSSLADRISPNALRQFERALRIREAFFAAGGTSPRVDLSLTHQSSHSSIRQALLTIGSKPIPTLPNDPPTPISWPNDSGQVMLQVSPPSGRTDAEGYSGNVWSLARFIRSGDPQRASGNVSRRMYVLGGRSITYDIGYDAVTNPFTMPELAEFECPQSLD
ncbi:type VI secretion system protein ImpL [Cognatiyoonia koreensis]|uniref:Type VI secretion system protein ImpL n=1 Tax=Cognatiyoonia koreensis TaxID=364200 RepID=A0A1I0RH74_9RHOB|nr:type VI secretion system membrane subunit TssM [Cognatiyoonia koreensis]SEW40150.1 type VI secretion system protein ImpL [Cognatiyoonia koreensis]